MPASLRSDGVRVHPGMPFGFPPESAFGFAGIPTSWSDTRKLAGTKQRNESRLALPIMCIVRASFKTKRAAFPLVPPANDRCIARRAENAGQVDAGIPRQVVVQVQSPQTRTLDGRCRLKPSRGSCSTKPGWRVPNQIKLGISAANGQAANASKESDERFGSAGGTVHPAERKNAAGNKPGGAT